MVQSMHEHDTVEGQELRSTQLLRSATSEPLQTRRRKIRFPFCVCLAPFSCLSASSCTPACPHALCQICTSSGTSGVCFQEYYSFLQLMSISDKLDSGAWSHDRCRLCSQPPEAAMFVSIGKFHEAYLKIKKSALTVRIFACLFFFNTSTLASGFLCVYDFTTG